MAKEDELVQKRIKDTQRRTDFLQKINEFKEEKQKVRERMIVELRSNEEKNRNRINFSRNITKQNIVKNQNSMLKSNKEARSQIRDMRDKIKQTI